MLSTGNGRHRRPRPTSPAMVTMATTVATGAGIALPLFGATGAQAAEGSTWDKVAACETGGQWNANTGNGFYGGLAITEDTWDSYGGDTYAERPDLATRAEQITVAEAILATLGPDAWPGCELSTGLLTDTAPSDVDPTETVPASPVQQPGEHATAGDTDTATPSDTPSETATDPSGTATPPPVTATPPTSTTTTPPTTGAPSGTATTPPATSATTAPPTTTTPPATTAPGGGKHAKPYSPTDDELAAQDQATRTQVYGVTGGTSTTGSTAPSTTSTGSAGGKSSGDTTTKSDGSDSTKSDEYTVGSGDSLSSIASAHHVDGGWSRLYELNQQVIGADPNLIRPGQIINLG